jgi:hypothetical protein
MGGALVTIRFTTLTLMTPWTDDVPDLDEAVHRLAQLGYIYGYVGPWCPGVAFTDVCMTTLEDFGEIAFIVSQGDRAHKIEFESNHDAEAFALRMDECRVRPAPAQP